eukprot:113515-Rhodomonas_salina.3
MQQLLSCIGAYSRETVFQRVEVLNRAAFASGLRSKQFLDKNFTPEAAFELTRVTGTLVPGTKATNPQILCYPGTSSF